MYYPYHREEIKETEAKNMEERILNEIAKNQLYHSKANPRPPRGVEFPSQNLSYQPQMIMGFGMAVELCKQGHVISRRSWGDKAWVTYCKETSHSVEGDVLWNCKAIRQYASSKDIYAFDVNSYFIYKAPDDSLIIGWNPCQADIDANDWVVINLNGSRK